VPFRRNDRRCSLLHRLPTDSSDPLGRFVE
jgi:hypothetical protein